MNPRVILLVLALVVAGVVLLGIAADEVDHLKLLAFAVILAVVALFVPDRRVG